MISTFTRILVTVLLLSVFQPQKISAQRINEALSNPVIMHYYTAAQLHEIAAADSNELNSIVYYFTLSYTVEPVRCYDCIPFDSATFDVTRYEHLRLQDSVYTREFTKYGFKLTLYPVNSLPYEYAIHNVPLLNPVEHKPTE